MKVTTGPAAQQPSAPPPGEGFRPSAPASLLPEPPPRPEDCRICGRLVLPVAGWAIEIPAHRHLVVNWRTGAAEFAGRLHYSCLRSWEHRAEFRDALEVLLRRGDITIAYPVAGRPHQVRQRGFHYPDEIFSGETCQVLQSDRSDCWVVLERDGAAHQVTYAGLQRIAAGLPARGVDGIDRTRLNVVPSASVPAETWPGLLERLGITDRYAGTVAVDTTYTCIGFDPVDTVLTYSVGTALPLPREAVTFLRGYADEYLTIDADVWETADVWDMGDLWDRPGS